MLDTRGAGRGRNLSAPRRATSLEIWHRCRLISRTSRGQPSPLPRRLPQRLPLRESSHGSTGLGKEEEGGAALAMTGDRRVTGRH